MPDWDEGQWLIDHRFELERGEARWLDRLGEFDAAGGWYADGQLSCVEWLVWFAKMARSTAFEKVRVARELRRRPIVAEAFREGRLSYSAVRTITRAEGADAEVDEALVHVAQSGSPADVERAVRTYHAYRGQEVPPAELVRRRRGISLRRTGDGLVRIEGYLTELEAAEVEAALAAVVAGEDGDDSEDGEPVESAADDSQMPGSPGLGDASPAEGAPGGDVAESPAGDWNQPDPGVDGQHWAARQADALLTLVRSGAMCGAPPPAGGADRYLTHVIIGPDGMPSLPDDTPLPVAEAARVACDSSLVEHHVNEAGEPLNLGRKTRVWSVAQRRAALVRDGGRCRFPGCGRRVADLHHHRWWEAGGCTDIDNGYLLCPHHHTLVHQGGFRVTGEPNRTLEFFRSDDRALGATSPVSRRPRWRRVAAHAAVGASWIG